MYRLEHEVLHTEVRADLQSGAGGRLGSRVRYGVAGRGARLHLHP
jgi:hypothetical protein